MKVASVCCCKTSSFLYGQAKPNYKVSKRISSKAANEAFQLPLVNGNLNCRE